MPSALELHSLRRPRFPSRVALEVKTLECSINYSRPASASLPQLPPLAATAVVPAHQTLLFFGGIPSDTPRARTLLYVAATLRFSFSAITAALVLARPSVLSIRKSSFVHSLGRTAFFAILLSRCYQSAALPQTRKHHLRGAVCPLHSTTGNCKTPTR